MALVIDGAPELRDAAEVLKKQRSDMLVLNDFKHRAANILKALEFEKLLNEGQRLPISTEILKSSFGLCKQLERQHSKGGFTSLLATFGSLLRSVTPETVRRNLARVSAKECSPG